MNETSGCKGEVDRWLGGENPEDRPGRIELKLFYRVDVHAAVSAKRMRTSPMTYTEAGRPYPKESITETTRNH